MTTSEIGAGLRCALLAALVGLWPAVSPALSLGEARVLSALDAPLEAEIDVLDVTPDELQALTVEIPSRDVFVRYGVVRPVYLETARVALARGKDGRPVLQLRTRAKVTDPFLTVLILADWGRGRVLREFNLVIDRPVLAPQAAAAAPIETPRVDAGTGAAVEREAPAVPPVAEPQASAPAASLRVAKGDTLLKFARRVADRGKVSIAQATIALYEANPQAFGGSVHELRAGAVLRLPTPEELAQLPRERALADYERQVSAWRNRGGAATAPAREPSVAGRLRLVAPTDAVAADKTPPKESAKTASEQGVGGESAKNSASASGSADTEERIAVLERELAESTRLLELRSRELAALQARVAESAPQSGVDLASALSRLWWLWALLVGVIVGLAFEIVRRARLERTRAFDLEPMASSPGFAEAPRTTPPPPPPPVVVPPPAAIAPAPPPIVPPAPPPAPPVSWTEEIEDLEGDPPPLDETGSRLDLARAYIEMGDPAAARAELEIVMKQGDDGQRLLARRLIESLRR